MDMQDGPDAMKNEPKNGRMHPEILNAFADGQLEPEDAARVVLHLADNPEDQSYVDSVMAMNALISRAHEGPAAAPVPPAMRDAILRAAGLAPEQAAGEARDNETRDNVVAFPRRRRVQAAFLGGAIAAGFAMLALFFPQAPETGFGLAEGPVSPRSPVHGALVELASGDTRLVGEGARMAVIASFAYEGGYCREFELAEDGAPARTAGLACGDGEEWRIEALAERGGDDDANLYMPAGGGDEDAFLSVLDALDAGLVLTPEAEDEARAQGWR